MAKSFEALVKAKLDSRDAKDALRQLENTEITLNKVTFNTQGLDKALATTITKALKSVNFNITPNIQSSGASNKIVAGYVSTARKAKNDLNKAFKGFSFEEAISIKDGLSGLDALEQKIKSLNGVTLSKSISADAQHITATLRQGTDVVQEFSYTLREVGNTKMYLLDPVNLTVLSNADRQLDSISQQLLKFKKNLDIANGIKIDENSYTSLKNQAEQLTREIQSFGSQSAVTKTQIDDLRQALANLEVDFSKSKSSFGEKTKTTTQLTKQLESDKKQIESLYRQFNTFMAKNPKARSFGNLMDLQSQLETMRNEALQPNGTIDHKAFKKLSDQIANATAQAKQFGMTGQTAFQQLFSKAKELSYYLMTSIAFDYAMRGIKAMVNNVVELDTAMTELKKTTDGSAESYRRFFTQAASISQDVGSNISDVIQSAAEWSRSGFALSEVGELAKASTMYMNVSEYEDVSDATTSLISTMKAFGVESQNIMTILDAFNAVGNTTATTSAGLGDAMMRSASALSVAGNTMQESLGLVVAANNTVQNPEKVGNGLKTIALRLRNTKGELEELGVETDGATESITKLQTQILNATSGRVNIFDQNGEFKSTYTILSELSNVWMTLDSVQKANLTTWIAGATQANTFSSIMENFSEGAQAVNTALYSEGSAMQENARYMDSIQGRINQLQASFQELSSTIVSSDFVKGAVSGIQSIVEALNAIISFDIKGAPIGALFTLFSSAGIAKFIKRQSTLKQIEKIVKDLQSGKSFSDIENLFVQLPKWAKKAVASTKGLSAESYVAMSSSIASTGASATAASSGFVSLAASIKSASVSMISFLGTLAANPITWLVGSIGTAAFLMYKTSKRFEDAAKKAQASNAAYEETKSELDGLTKSYEDNRNQLQELNKLRGTTSFTLSTEAEIDALMRQNNEIKQQISLLKYRAQIEKDTASSDARKALTTNGVTSHSKKEGYMPQTGNNQSGTLEQTDIIEAAKQDLARLKVLKQEYDDLYANWDKAKSGSSEKGKYSKKLIRKRNEIQTYQGYIDEYVSQINSLADGLDSRKDIGLLKQISQFNVEVSSIDATPAERAQAQLSRFFTGFTSSNAISEQISEMIKKGDSATTAIQKLGLSLEDLGLEESQSKYLTQYFDDLAKKANEAHKAVSEVDGTLEGYKSASDTDNQGSQFDFLISAISVVQDLYEKGLTGTDDFKTFASMLNNGSQNAQANLDNFESNINRIKKYLTESDEGVYSATKSDMQGLADAMNAAGKEAQSSGKEFKSTADIAKELNVPIEFLELAMRKMEEYDISVPFKNLPRSAQILNDAKSYLEMLKGEYESMYVGAEKTALGNKISAWEEQISQASQDIDLLNTDILLNIKLEYDIATLQSEIDSIRSDIQMGNDNAENRARLNSLNRLKIETKKEQINVSNVSATVSEFKVSQHAIETIQQQLATNKDLTAEEKLALQVEITNLQDAQIKILDAFQKAHPEITPETDTSTAESTLQSWIQSAEGKQIIADVTTDITPALNQISSLTGVPIADLTVGLSVQDNATPVVDSANDSKLADKSANITITNTTPLVLPTVLSQLSRVKNKEATITLNRVTKYSTEGAPAFNGTAHVSGTAYASGDWGIKKNETALVNELGKETIVRDGKWFTVNNGFPAFTKLKKGDIVFNHKQTEELQKKGYVTNSHARVYGSYASGTAYADGTKNSFDWIEIALDRLESIIKKYTTRFENTFSGFNSRLKDWNEATYKTKEELQKQQAAYKSYINAANKINLSESLKQNVRNGSNYIYDGYSDSEKEAIDKYKDLIDNAQSASEAIEELSVSIAELYQDAYDIVRERYEDEFDALTTRKKFIENNIDLVNARGYSANPNDYQSLMRFSQREIEKGKQEYAALLQKQNEAVASGYVTKFSHAWWEMQNEIYGVAAAIQESEIALAEYQQAVLDLNWDNFDYMQDQVSQVVDETAFLIGLFDDLDMYNEDGTRTDAGLATLYLRQKKMEEYKKQAQGYADAINEVDKLLMDDPANKNLIDRRNDLISKQQDLIQSTQSEKQAIKDLISEGYDAQVEALQNVIDSYEESMDSARDLYDFQKKIQDGTKNLSDLQKQLAAYSNDTSEEARAKLQQIQVELENAQRDLDETTYDQYISDTKKLLDNLSDDYKEALFSGLDNIDYTLSEILSSVGNIESAQNTIGTAASNAGYNVSGTLADIINYGNVANSLSNLENLMYQIANASGSVGLNASNDPIVNGDGTVSIKNQKNGTYNSALLRSSLIPIKSSNSSILPRNTMPVTSIGDSSVSNVSNSSYNRIRDMNFSHQWNINIEHASEWKDIVKQMKNDPEFPKYIRSVSVDMAVGKHPLSYMKYWNQ